jgi:hypothetical protein
MAQYAQRSFICYGVTEPSGPRNAVDSAGRLVCMRATPQHGSSIKQVWRVAFNLKKSPTSQYHFSIMAYVEIVDLPPAPQPVGVFTAMCQHTATLSLRVDEIISVCGNDFGVNDLQTGEAVFQVGGKASLYRKPSSCPTIERSLCQGADYIEMISRTTDGWNRIVHSRQTYLAFRTNAHRQTEGN